MHGGGGEEEGVQQCKAPELALWARRCERSWSGGQSWRVVVTHLMGEESLEVEEAGWGLEDAENIGQEGERGEAGLRDTQTTATMTTVTA